MMCLSDSEGNVSSLEIVEVTIGYEFIVSSTVESKLLFRPLDVSAFGYLGNVLDAIINLG